MVALASPVSAKWLSIARPTAMRETCAYVPHWNWTLHLRANSASSEDLSWRWLRPALRFLVIRITSSADAVSRRCDEIDPPRAKGPNLGAWYFPPLLEYPGSAIAARDERYFVHGIVLSHLKRRNWQNLLVLAERDGDKEPAYTMLRRLFETDRA
jgi:hypothetical protein